MKNLGQICVEIDTLTVGIIESVLKNLKIPYTEEDVKQWKEGNFAIIELHITHRFRTDSHPSVARVINYIFRNSSPSLCAGRLKHGIGVRLYNRERRAEWLFYDKLLEMKDKRRKFENNLRAVLGDSEEFNEVRGFLEEEASSSIRCELKLDVNYLAHHGLMQAKAWLGRNVKDLYFRELKKLRLGTILSIEHVLKMADRLKDKKLRQTFLLWVHGEDIEALYGYQTFNRRRKAIKAELGIDIRKDCVPSGPRPGNIEKLFSRDNVLSAFPRWTKQYREVAFKIKKRQ